MEPKHTHHEVIGGHIGPWDEHEWDLGFAILRVETYSDGSHRVNWTATDGNDLALMDVEARDHEIELTVRTVY